MKTIYRLVILLLLAPSFLHAQSNYKPGYVVNAGGDTLKGFIDYREWVRNPTSLSFKTDVNAKAEKYTVANAAGFVINGMEAYEKFVAPVSKSVTDINTLSHLLDTAFSVDTVFLRVSVTGKNVSLYSYTDEIKTRYYVLDRHTKQINELKKFTYIDDGTNLTIVSPDIISTNSYIKTINSYRLQLIRLATLYQPDDKNIIAKIQGSEYVEPAFVEIFKAINGGSDQQTIHESDFGIRFFAGLAVRNSKLTFNSTLSTPFPNGTNDATVSPVIAGGIDFLLNKHTQKIFFRFDFELASNHFIIPATAINNGAPGSTASLDVKQLSFLITPQFIYNIYSKDKFKFFIDLGMSIGLPSYNNYNYISTYGSTNQITIQNKYPEFKSSYVAFPVKVGISINKQIEVYGTYWPKTDLTPYLYIAGNMNSYQAGVNYLFGK